MWKDKINMFGNLSCSECDVYYYGYEHSHDEPPYYDDSCPRCERKDHLIWLITKKLKRPTTKEHLIRTFEDIEKRINSIIGGRSDAL